MSSWEKLHSVEILSEVGQAVHIMKNTILWSNNASNANIVKYDTTNALPCARQTEPLRRVTQFAIHDSAQSRLQEVFFLRSLGRCWMSKGYQWLCEKIHNVKCRKKTVSKILLDLIRKIEHTIETFLTYNSIPNK